MPPRPKYWPSAPWTTAPQTRLVWYLYAFLSVWNTWTIILHLLRLYSAYSRICRITKIFPSVFQTKIYIIIFIPPVKNVPTTPAEEPSIRRAIFTQMRSSLHTDTEGSANSKSEAYPEWVPQILFKCIITLTPTSTSGSSKYSGCRDYLHSSKRLRPHGDWIRHGRNLTSALPYYSISHGLCHEQWPRLDNSMIR